MTDGFFAHKRVFVTGTTGFKGSWLSLWLSGLGAEVTGYSLAPDTSPNLFDAALVGETGIHHIADITDLDKLRNCVAQCRPHLVLHLAAQSLVRRSYTDPVSTWRTNVLGTVNLLEACRGMEGLQAVVVISSDKCYLPLSEPRPLREDDRLGGHDPYSASKACVELATASYAKSFALELPPIASARAGNVIGGGDFAEDRLVPDCVRALERNLPVELRNPAHVRPWQHVLEPLAGYLRLCRLMAQAPDNHAGHGGWNFAPDTPAQIEVGELARRAVALWGRGEVRITAPALAPRETANLLLDNAKARKHLDWRPRLGLDETLDWTVSWYKAFFEGVSARTLCMGQIHRYEAILGQA